MGMMLIGTVLGLGVALTRSLYITYFSFVVVLVSISLTEATYLNDPWAALIIGFGLSLLIIVLTIAKNKGALKESFNSRIKNLIADRSFHIAKHLI